MIRFVQQLPDDAVASEVGDSVGGESRKRSKDLGRRGERHVVAGSAAAADVAAGCGCIEHVSRVQDPQRSHGRG